MRFIAGMTVVGSLVALAPATPARAQYDGQPIPPAPSYAPPANLPPTNLPPAVNPPAPRYGTPVYPSPTYYPQNYYSGQYYPQTYYGGRWAAVASLSRWKPGGAPLSCPSSARR